MGKLNLISTGRSGFRFLTILAVLAVILCSGSTPLRADTELKVKRVVITGNATFTRDQLGDLLKVKKGNDFKAQLMRIDQILITNYYTLRGFLDVYVSSTFQKNGKDITVQYDIIEGRRYYLKAVDIRGNELFPENILRREIKIAAGKPYNTAAVQEGLNQIESFYLDNGKPYVVFETEEAREDSLVTFKLAIKEGKTVVVEQIRYEGRKRVKAFLMRRELEIRKGENYSRLKIETSQRNLYSTGLFKFVDYRVMPIAKDESRVELVWTVVEKKPLWLGLRFGVGYEDRATTGNVTTYDFTAEAGHRNLAGTARSVSARIVPSFFYGRTIENGRRRLLNPKNEYSFTYVEPWVLNTRTPGTIRVAYSQEQEPVAIIPITIFSVSGDLSHVYSNSYWSYTGGISYQSVDINRNAAIPLNSNIRLIYQGNDDILALSFNPKKDKRDNVILTQRGYVSEVRTKLAYAKSRPTVNGMIGERVVSTYFFKTILQWSRYQGFRYKPSWVLATRVRAGAIFELGRPGAIREFPTTERFYLGGASTVRGYAEQMIGEVDELVTEDGERIALPVGGKYQLLMNAELRLPLFWLFYGEIFTDIGNIWQQRKDLANFSLKAGSGAGIAFITPFGPIRFDYGLKWFPAAGESAGDFHIGISFAF
ncbi:MAG: BamA/TamA family outer membrane protein [Calditrichae bacterium]|nr:BamA/TamA family outer membrane protein [Calditrichia bacterium]